jgi:O-antigen ligase
MLFWSRDELFEVFHGGKIQGIVGNSALLAFVALLGIIVFAVQLMAGTLTRRWAILWLVVAAANFVFANSATNVIGLLVVVLAAGALLLLRRASTHRARLRTSLGLVGIALIGAIGALVLRGPLLGLLGKTDTLTGRLGIWEAVITLAQQRPAAGWGWVGYWVPWVSPFDTLAFRNGVRQLHAHNAWIDLWFQLGVLGLIVFGALVISTLIRSWAYAVDRPQSGFEGASPYSAVTLLPVLIVVALIVQSLAESRLLVEYGLFLLALVAVKTKADQRAGTL